ncbi:alternative oxidase, mitochondrial [Cryptococcus sp. DSM 104548]
MSTLARRPIMTRPIIYTTHISSARSFSVSARTLSQATQLRHNSLSLQRSVRQADEQRHEPTVGSEGKGVEGPHPKDQVPVNALSGATGPWTMFNPIYTDKELNTVQVIERTPVTLGDKVTKGVVKSLRRVFDVITRYTPYEVPESVLKQEPIPVAQLRAEGKLLSDHKWLFRIILLESIAGVPGMVGGTLRHLRSMRLLKRDGGWIHTLLEEAENERMHLLTFMTVAQPNWFTRSIVLVAQGVFYNVFFLTYLLSPKIAHRFVAALEEEAVRTYTHCVKDMESGLIPEWQDKPAPRIAIDYWRLPNDAKLLDVIKAVRADEATHRFVNHSLANLDQKRDFNPFALAEASPEDRGLKWGYTREESALFAQRQQQKLIEESTIGSRV